MVTIEQGISPQKEVVDSQLDDVFFGIDWSAFRNAAKEANEDLPQQPVKTEKLTGVGTSFDPFFD